MIIYSFFVSCDREREAFERRVRPARTRVPPPGQLALLYGRRLDVILFETCTRLRKFAVGERTTDRRRRVIFSFLRRGDTGGPRAKTERQIPLVFRVRIACDAYVYAAQECAPKKKQRFSTFLTTWRTPSPKKCSRHADSQDTRYEPNIEYVLYVSAIDY